MFASVGILAHTSYAMVLAKVGGSVELRCLSALPVAPSRRIVTSLCVYTIVSLCDVSFLSLCDCLGSTGSMPLFQCR